MSISFNPSGLLSGNGIDVSTVVSQLISQQSAPLQIIQKQQTGLQNQSDELTSINGDLNSLATAVSALADPTGQLAALGAVSSDPSILTATAQTSAATGTHEIVVSNLATTSSYYTNSIPSGSALSPGSFALKVGTNAPVTFNISGNSTTLRDLANDINSANAGVTASVINDANGSRLSLVSNNSGAPGDLSVTNDTTGLGFTKGTTGINASLSVDGVPISSATNTVTGALPGVTLSLVSSNSNEPVQLSVGSDTQQATQAINNFVAAYNKVVGDINQQFTVDPSTNTEGVLGSDSSLRSLQSSLLNDATFSISGNNGVVNLASLGINMNDDGTLTVDNTQLSSTLASNPSAVQNFFQNSSLTGFANAFNHDLNNLTDPTQGILNLELNQNATQQQDLGNQISDFQAQLAVQQIQLINQYSTVNALLEEYPLTLEAITAQLGGSSVSNSNSSSGSPATPQ
jgi:flagellar hook-associated protein 2